MKRNDETKHPIWKHCLAVLAGLLIILAVVFRYTGATLQDVFTNQPSDLALTALILLLLYALKSATIVFPLLALEIAVGYMFPAPTALLVNLAGVAISFTVPYFMGRFLGLEALQKAIRKHPKLSNIIDRQQHATFFLCYFLRVIGGLPCDLVTMWLGATRVPYWQNICGGCLGILPKMILATLMGNSIEQPGSPTFILSVVLTVLLSVLSFVVHELYQRWLRRHGKTPPA